MSLAQLCKNTVRLLLLGILMVALLGAFGATQPTLAAQDTPLRIVRNDGALFDIKSSALPFSPSQAVTVAPENLVNAEVGAKNLPPLGDLSPESVIGADGRTQITNTTVYPNSAIAHLEVDFPSGSGTCTGWFMSKNRLATAGHCVYDAGAGEWATSITVYPGRNGGSAPFGSYTAGMGDLYTNTGWTGTGNPKYDYGLVKLGSDVGNTVGWFGYGWTSSDSFLLNRKSNVRGYPGDKSYGTLWTMKGKIQTVQKTRLFYSIDTFGGQSGSPHYGKWSTFCNPCSFGIHTYGVGGSWTKNSSTRITKRVFNFLGSAGNP
ncbi:MAG: serine protease [Chloroflexi bacterium]|nr:serine protease [Chloroflexota bacterium]